MRSSILFLLFFPLVVSSQVKKEFDYSSHLIKEGRLSENIAYLRLFDTLSLPAPSKDSLRFLKGKTKFYLKEFEEASLTLEYPCLASSQICEASSYYQVLAKLYNNEEIDSTALSSTLPDNDLTALFQYGNAIIEGRRIESYSETLTNMNNFLIKKHYKDLQSYVKQFPERRKKSPALAAAMSAVVPGTGKIYAGRIGEGFASLLLVGILGASTIEQYRNGGFGNVQFYLIGVPTAFFYLGSIYGSYFSVKVSNREIQEEIRNEVLFHLHIPFRSLYNQ